MVLVNNNIKKFDNGVDLVIANRYDDKLDELSNEVYTRDVFRKD